MNPWQDDIMLENAMHGRKCKGTSLTVVIKPGIIKKEPETHRSPGQTRHSLLCSDNAAQDNRNDLPHQARCNWESFDRDRIRRESNGWMWKGTPTVFQGYVLEPNSAQGLASRGTKSDCCVNWWTSRVVMSIASSRPTSVSLVPWSPDSGDEEAVSKGAWRLAFFIREARCTWPSRHLSP